MEKRQNESESIQNQKALLLRYAAERGWDVYEVYCDGCIKIGLNQKQP